MKSRFVQRENYGCLKFSNRVKAFIEQEFVNLTIPVRLESLSSFFCDITKIVVLILIILFMRTITLIAVFKGYKIGFHRYCRTLTGEVFKYLR